MGAVHIPCFSLDARTYYALATDGHADHTVRIGDGEASSSIRIHLIDEPESADFVMVDDLSAAATCRAEIVKTVRLNDEGTPDIVVTLSPDQADYRLYVRSTAFSPTEIAALFALSRTAGRSHGLAQR